MLEHVFWLCVMQIKSRSFEMTMLSIGREVPISISLTIIVTMSVSRIAFDIGLFSVKEWRDLETGDRGRSRSLKMAPFDRPYIGPTTFYWSAIVSRPIALCCTIFELFDIQ